jgi:predicted nucleic acid-binding protein
MIRWPVPPEVYLDTSVIVAALFTGTPDAEACLSYCRALANADSKVYVSQVMRLDLARALRRLATKPDKVPAELRQEYKLDDWGRNPLIRQRWLRHAVRELDALLRQFGSVAELPFTLDV